ncbi:unnamed protein product [Ceutorhynchus assimilis]|uniref:Secreted protein n=1 Tax=Ceutorhynchus assimilis TaxID=467358 RepID=A0A9N9MLL9_9CUCU|nr:unnamed protein product [Ceutorhynchus assimilis]
MSTILRLVFAALIFVEIDYILADEDYQERCHYCRSQDISECVPAQRSYGCPRPINQCISASVLLTDRKTNATHPLFLRRCWKGGCEELKKQDLKVLYCKTCNGKDNCNDDTIPEIDDVDPQVSTESPVIDGSPLA